MSSPTRRRTTVRVTDPVTLIWFTATALTVAVMALPGRSLLVTAVLGGVSLASAVVLVRTVVGLRRHLHLLEVTRASEVYAQRERDRRQFEALVRHAADVVLVIDAEGRVAYASPSATAMFGGDPSGWSHTELATQLHPDERAATLAALTDRLAAGDGRPVRIRARFRDPEGRDLHAELVAVDLLHDPDVSGIVITIHDTTERSGLEAELRRLAFHDPLTGLPNRILFQDRLVQALARAARVGRPIAVLICDLDDFKDVNDTRGHPAGDQLLQVLAERFKDAVRASDTVARIGGDEFAVLCEGLDATRDATYAARRLLAATDEPVRVDGTEVRIGLSVGIAVDTGTRSADEMLRDADIALYEAKALGKRRWSLHRTTMTVRAQARLQLGADLASAVRDDDLHVVFQPVHELAGGQLVGAEALARWQHPVRGAVPPDEFIAMAEENGLILKLGDRVLQAALDTAGRWSASRPDVILRIGVNVSPRQLHDPTLQDRVEAALARTDVPADRLVLELTESVMLEDPERALQIMHGLRELGVRFAIDDFGTGYSSLAYLRRLPVDIVKIDRSFVSELTVDRSAHDLVRSIVRLTAEMGLDAVAEGVETDAQRQLLRDLGCGFAQGYLYGRPTDEESFLAALPGRVGPSRTSTGRARSLGEGIARGA